MGGNSGMMRRGVIKTKKRRKKCEELKRRNEAEMRRGITKRKTRRERCEELKRGLLGQTLIFILNVWSIPGSSRQRWRISRVSFQWILGTDVQA
jgi:hypothetical protein